MNPILKYLITSGLVVAVSEAAKRNDRLGAVIGALPMMTILTLIWLRLENQSQVKISSHAYYTFWYVLPTLPMFFVFPVLHAKVGFWQALSMSAIITVASFFLLASICKRFGVILI